jgi:hypothetical protein
MHGGGDVFQLSKFRNIVNLHAETCLIPLDIIVDTSIQIKCEKFPDSRIVEVYTPLYGSFGTR